MSVIGGSRLSALTNAVAEVGTDRSAREHSCLLSYGSEVRESLAAKSLNARKVPDLVAIEANASWSSSIDSIVARSSRENERHNQQRCQKREKTILRAALRVFARQGIVRTRMQHIASEAGMPVSCIYNYFLTKEDIAYAAPLEHIARFFREYRCAVAKALTFRERLWTFLWLTADFARRNPQWARLFYLEISPSVLISQTMVRRRIDDLGLVVADLIQGGEITGEWACEENASEIATVLIGSVNQVITVWLIYRKPRNLMRTVTSVVASTMLLLETPRAATERKHRSGAALRTNQPDAGPSHQATLPPVRQGSACCVKSFDV